MVLLVSFFQPGRDGSVAKESEESSPTTSALGSSNPVSDAATVDLPAPGGPVTTITSCTSQSSGGAHVSAKDYPLIPLTACAAAVRTCRKQRALRRGNELRLADGNPQQRERASSRCHGAKPPRRRSQGRHQRKQQLATQLSAPTPDRCDHRSPSSATYSRARALESSGPHAKSLTQDCAPLATAIDASQYANWVFPALELRGGYDAQGALVLPRG